MLDHSDNLSSDIICEALHMVVNRPFDGEKPYTHQDAPALSWPFFSSRVPNISIDHYVNRLLRSQMISCEGMLVAISIMERLQNVYRVRENNKSFRYTMQCAHRIIATSVCIARKVIDDIPKPQKMFAAIVGVEVSELFALELLMLKTVDWRILPTSEELERLRNECLMKVVLQ
eukprot:PhF_6_TR4299/c0_g1_i1/m.5804